jgi:hypothetical protein
MVPGTLTSRQTPYTTSTIAATSQFQRLVSRSAVPPRSSRNTYASTISKLYTHPGQRSLWKLSRDERNALRAVVLLNLWSARVRRRTHRP